MKSLSRIPIDPVGIAERIHRFSARSVKKETKLGTPLRLIDFMIGFSKLHNAL